MKKKFSEYNIIDNNDLKRFLGKEVIIFGAGADGQQLLNMQDEIGFKVVAFWDNGAAGKSINNISVYNFEIGASKYKEYQVLILASSRFSYQMVRQIKNEKELEAIKYYVWNNEQYGDIARNVIEHNNNLWSNKKIKSANKILIPFVPFHDIYFVSHAYSANYLANKHDAEIWCYLRRDNYPEMASKSVINLYSSINARGIIEEYLPNQLKQEGDSILNTVWNKINSVDDWKKIKIYGMEFGESIIREYMRFNIPSFDYKSHELYDYLKKIIYLIVFWKNYFEKEHDIKAVMLWDGVCYESFIRDIAVSYGIPVYAIHYTQANRCFFNSNFGYMYKHFKKFFELLNDKEKKYGIDWAKKQLAARLEGDLSDISYMDRSVFSCKDVPVDIVDNNKIKVLICPHSFQDDIYCYGEQLFNSPFEWLCYLGELANRTDYDWYIKKHPASDARDNIIIDRVVAKYPRLKLIPTWISPHQLKKEGISVALTVFGTIGHEYPALGINVINAGNNPHVAFNFSITPTTLDAYKDILLHLDELKNDIDMDEIYQFYCIYYLYYKAPYRSRYDVFFDDPEKYAKLKENNVDVTTLYREYLEDWEEDAHKRTQERIKALFDELDNYDYDVFYKNDLNVE